LIIGYGSDINKKDQLAHWTFNPFASFIELLNLIFGREEEEEEETIQRKVRI
jgi:hypothetical protein